MIRVVDYGVGNIQAFMTMFKRLGLPAERAQTPADLSGATRLILPGVGAFDHAMQLLNDSGMRFELERLVLQQQVPVLGVCVGMQMLASGSDEGELPGLNWVPGRVRAFSTAAASASLPMPHMGWNDLKPNGKSRLFQQGFEETPRFYFLHSFYFDAADKTHVAATANYGLEFDAVVSHGHIHGVQCHPEKSHHWGAQLLKNFAEL
ncbi:imidazole glycerol phosphate synthase subunit HisH [Jeongeupia naejangsanensis]|uniref:Imidazole glycerol phosphate synthase subunit HisH n=1 Tax=Jeongeupia naejangsanensis TaxID=613195 RepID=A0ABS2BP23_9NEIS|nr:imidazole glycerol phosphate synthase subunit HisH [Jeongeupia naejangsanensis]MBM3117387.1 imidazole glycerol phosphate synthase subunit HisH [Jeongeupia naejangsanensis]